jgi:hypothetical protein
MSGDNFDKFGWLKALQSDPRYTDKEQRLGSIMCVQFARRDGTGWSVELDDIGVKMPTGMGRSRMKTALAKFVRDGYLQETGKSLGGRGVKAWRSYNLTKPYPVQVQVSDETRPSTGTGLGETCSTSEQNPSQYGTKPVPLLNTETSADLHEDPPKGTSKGTSKGTGAPASADAPPSPRCPKHINDNNPPNCHACGKAREAAQDFEARRAEAEKQARADALARRDNCTACDEFGFLLGPDGTSTNPATRCNVHNQAEAS